MRVSYRIVTRKCHLSYHDIYNIGNSIDCLCNAWFEKWKRRCPTIICFHIYLKNDILLSQLETRYHYIFHICLPNFVHLINNVPWQRSIRPYTYAISSNSLNKEKLGISHIIVPVRSFWTVAMHGRHCWRIFEGALLLCLFPLIVGSNNLCHSAFVGG